MGARNTAINSAAGVVEDAASFGLNSLSSRTAWSRTKRMMQNKWQWQRADMEAAGINPLLGAFPAPMGQTSQTAPAKIDVVSNVLQGKRISQEKQSMESMILRNAAAAEADRARVIHSVASAEREKVQTDLLKLDVTARTNAQTLEEDWPYMQKIERIVRVLGPLVAAGAGGLMGGKVIRQMLKRYRAELKKMKAAKRHHNVPSAVRGAGRVGNPARNADGSPVKIIATPSPQHRSTQFEDF